MTTVPGIAPDALEKIFERFYTDRPEQGFGQNSGLGLSISKQIVEAHAGRMWAENRMSVATPDEPPPSWARASSCACRRIEGGCDGDGACLRGADRQPRGADPRACRQRQVAPGAWR